MSTVSTNQRSYGSVSFQQLAFSWLHANQYRLKASSYSVYHTKLIKYLIPYFQKHTVANIDQTVILSFVSCLSAPSAYYKIALKPSTINLTLSILYQILSYGEFQYHLVIPPHRMPFAKYRNLSVLPFSMPELHSLIQYLLSLSTPESFGILIAVYTGIRIGELCSLQWKDISKDGVMHISKTIQRVQNTSVAPGTSRTNVLISPPKTTASIRDIPLPHFLYEKIISYRAFPEHYILTDSICFIEPRLLQYHFRKHLQACQLVPHKFHTLRHTFATLCIQSGIDYKTLSELLGHASVKTTLSIYVHSNLQMKRTSIETLSSVLK